MAQAQALHVEQDRELAAACDLEREAAGSSPLFLICSMAASHSGCRPCRPRLLDIPHVMEVQWPARTFVPPKPISQKFAPYIAAEITAASPCFTLEELVSVSVVGG